MSSLQRLAAELLLLARLSPWLRRRATHRGAFVLMFHGTPAAIPKNLPLAARPALDRAGLAAVLDWVVASDSPVIGPEQLLAGRPGILLTFDDGFANNTEQALPELESRGLPALFFVTLQHVLDPQDWLPSVRQALLGFDTTSLDPPTRHDLFDGMSVTQLRALAASPLASLGSHTLSHPFLTRCETGQLEHELGASRSALSELTGSSVDLLAYPTGDYDLRVVEATMQAGYRAAFAENERGAGHPSFEIPRVGIYEASRAVLEAKLSGLFRRPWRAPQ